MVHHWRVSGDSEKPQMADRGSAAVVRSFYAAFETEDHEAAIRPLLSPHVVWRVSGDNPLAGTFRGHTEVLNTQVILGEGVHAVAIHDVSGIRHGRSYLAHEIDLFHVENGTITEMWSFSEDQVATDRMWS
jgi:ketosteroid isomerase-like protein